MHARVIKRETDTYLELTLRMFADQVSLHLDKGACLKCDICSLVCPREAVAILPGEEELDITIDPRRCVLCEVCAHFCPVGAVTLFFNGVPKTILLDNQGLASFLPKVAMDKSRCVQPCPTVPDGELHWCRRQAQLVANVAAECPKHCHRCLEACPRQAIVLDEAEGQTLPQPDQCLRCRQCLEVCEYEAIQVYPQFEGTLTIAPEKCPPDCCKCINLCPVKAIAREGERVFLKREVCSFCGVCRNICDQEAITLVRREVVAQPGEFSQAWQHAVDKLLER